MVGVIAMIRMFFQSAKSLQWHSINPTTFQRNMASNEMFHALSGVQKVPTGRRWRDVTAIARLRTESGQTMSIEQVTAAWISLRRKHPAMASVVEGSKRLYHKADEEELQSWLKETLVILTEDEDIIPELLHRLEVAPRPALYFLVKSSIFVIRTPHHTMDAVGLMRLLNDFLKELDSPEGKESALPFDEQATDLACSMQEATQAPRPSIMQLYRLWKLSLEWKKRYPSIGIPPDQPDVHSAISAWQDLQLSETMTDNLLKGARKHGLTLTHVCHAALMVAAKAHSDNQELSNYTNVIIMNIRNRAADPSMQDRNVASTQHAIWPFTVPVTDFLATAHQVKDRYVTATQNKDLLPLAESVFLDGIRMMDNSDHWYRAPGVSSYGKVDNFVFGDHSSFEIEDVSFAVESSKHDLVAAIWSYKGKMTIRVMYNRGYHSDKSIERYLQMTEREILGGLGLD